MMLRRTVLLVTLLSNAPCSEASAFMYDPRFCYILDAILLVYGTIITLFFVRERAINKNTRQEYDVTRRPEEGRAGCRRDDSSSYMPLQRKTDDLYRKIEVKPDRRHGEQLYQGLSVGTKDTCDSLHMQPLHSTH